MTRRESIKIVGLATASLLINNTLTMANDTNKISFKLNPDLVTIKPNWNGNKLVNNTFVYEPEIQAKKFIDIIKWKWGKNPLKEAKKADTFKLEIIPNNKPTSLNENEVVWLGHSSFIMKIAGKVIITDPILGKLPMIGRLSKLPCKHEEITGLDYILLSHDHRDHCDIPSLKILLAQNPNVKILTTFGLGEIINGISKKHAVQEAAWFQEYKTESELKITYLPAKHWCKRGLTDLNKRLWGSFMIQSANKTIYFAADTAYDVHFKEIATIFPNIDIAFMPVGAYKPEHIMKENHVSPDEAVQGFNDLKAKHFIPMHYGTFDLSDEPAGEPEQLLKKAQETNTLQGKLHILKPGLVWQMG